MKIKTSVLLCALAFAASAHASDDGKTRSKTGKRDIDVQLDSLRTQIAELEQQVKTLKAEQHANAATSARIVRAASTNASTNASAGTNTIASTSTLSEEDARAMREQLNSLTLKTDALEDAATTGPLAGLSVTGYIDPLYLYNRAQGTGGFQFLNHDPGVYDYYESQIGDVYLDIKKTFGVGPLAPAAEIVIQPNRGVGSTLSSGRGYVGNNILSQADVTVPLNSLTTFTAGLLQSPIGYEPLPSNQMLTLTHNLLYDFSEPAGMVGMGLKGNNATFTHFWQVYIANEQLRTASAVVDGPNNTSRSNWVPSISARFDNALSTALDIGIAAMYGRSTLYSPCSNPGGYGYQCNASSPFGMMRYIESDLTYIRDKTQFNAQVDYGEQQKGAWDGGTARWYGFSLQGHQKWTSAWFGHMGATLRFDYLNNTANGGGAPNILYGLSGSNPSVNATSGFGIDPACFAASSRNGTECRGAQHYDLTADLLFFPTQQITVKFEYRHDAANHPVFLMHDGTYSRSNDIVAGQFIYTF
ncbi:DUF3138 family protein [Paraburkholderia sp. Ac-20340]|uniref:DUF3138 family protein n=1 Tax=Paraburkholderia sp. Ac-20340 TaxID=2703888 RepID=UPI00197E8E5A|nr:DUF3138 family protein [Paraburkholderia sp. Ac-20340]MBN3853237.1 DUF3138 family protein [Paraburkholderia sp. Ac-20340]